MSEDADLLKYKNDPRVACKYGTLCYQKNEAHHKKFKHLPKKRPVKDEDTDSKPQASFSNENDNVDNIGKPKDDKVKKNNFLTNWLKPPPLKVRKVEEAVKDETKLKDTSEASTTSHVNEDKEKVKVEEKKVHSSSDAEEPISDDKGSDKTSAITSISIAPIKMDAPTKIKTFFLVDMPQDFYKFWEFCESMGSLLLVRGNPLDALKIVGLKLVGPFEVLADKFNENTIYNKSALLRHYRYYYDPPEFQTVIIKEDDSSSGYHLGYFRDDPKENPVFVASNCASENGIIKPEAENLFGAVNVYLESYKKKADPFVKLKVVKLQNSLTTWAKKENMTLSTSTVSMKRRESNVVARTFHKGGLVVPFNKKTNTGYRELAEDDATIKKILKSIVESEDVETRRGHFSRLQPIVTFANIANDECDFGASLELGLDLFTFGSPLLHELVRSLLSTSYGLLNRSEFIEIIEAHLEDRRKGSDLSILKRK